MAVKHQFESAKTDGADATIVRPSNWNAEHKADFVNGLVKADANGFLVKAVAGTDYLINSYTLPAATSTVLGGIELFSDTSQSTAANNVTTTASRTYGLQVNAAGQGVVNVPWTDTVYTHPTYTYATPTADTGTTLASIPLISTLTQTNGHVTGGTMRKLVAGSNITITPGSDGNITIAVSSPDPSHGQCRLIKSGNNLLLQPLNGNKLIINGTAQTIPSAGVSLAPPATSNTTYYIYAYMNGPTITLEASTTGHATNSTNGVEIKSGDATRSLVGMARTVSSAWVDTFTSRFVRTWFNDQGVGCEAVLSTNTTITSAPWVVLGNGTRFDFLVWASEVCAITAEATSQDSISWGIHYNAARLDGSAVYAESYFHVAYSARNMGRSVTSLTEGYHYFEQAVGISSGNAPWWVSGYSKIGLTTGGRP